MLIKNGIYLDANAGTPLKVGVQEALLSLLGESVALIPNPSSIHAHGRRGKRALAEARERIAFSLGSQVDPEQLIFTSSGSESNQLAIRSALESHLQSGKKPHWITTSVEHDSVRQMKSWLLERGGSVSELSLDAQGRPRLDALEGLVCSETALISLLWVNNETGVITEIEPWIQKANSLGIPIHIDAAQAWGKLPIDLSRLPAQYVTFSGHKIGALAGVGVLWVNRGVPIESVMRGKQEKGRRGGSENLLGIVSLGHAAFGLDPKAWASRVQPLRDRLEKELTQRVSGVIVNGGEAPRVANTLNVNFQGVERDGLVMALDLAGYSVSSGSACSSGVLEPSHVLQALGRSDAQAMAAVRVSLVDELPWESLEGFIQAVEKAVSRIRGVEAQAYSSSLTELRVEKSRHS